MFVAINISPIEIAFVLSNPFNRELIALLKKWKRHEQSTSLIVTEPENISAFFKEGGAGASEQLNQDLLNHVSISDMDEEQSAESGPIVQLSNHIIEQAYAMRASDIHIEPWENEVVIRYRIDGALRIVNRLPHRGLFRPLASRLKLMGELDIFERRLPQDGRIVFKDFSK